MKKTERIEIEGEALDLKEGGERLSFSLTSNLLHGLADYTSCYSYSYEVPNSPRNRRILGQLLLPGANNRKVRQKLPCRYFRDGLELLSGSVYVSAATASEISLNMVFGLDSLRELVEGGLNIYELDWSETPTIAVSENGAAVGLSVWRYEQDEPPATVFEFANEIYFGELSDTYPKHPFAVKVSEITDRIKEKYDVELDGVETGGDFLQFAPEYRKSGTWGAGRAYHSEFSHILYVSSPLYVGMMRGYKYTGINDLDCAMRYKGTGENADWALPKLRATSTVLSLAYDFANNSPYTFSVYVQPVVGDDYAETLRGLFNGVSSTPNPDRLLCTVKPGEQETGEASMLDVGLPSEYQPLAVYLVSNNKITAAQVEAHVSISSKFSYPTVSSGTLTSGDCLPEITLAEFLTQYAQLRHGRFAVNSLRGGNTIRFKSLEDVGAATPYDWSDKLLADGMRHSYSLDDLARKNWLHFGSDDSEAVYIEGYYNKAYPTNDATIEAEADFSEVSFSYSYRPAGSARMLTYVYGEAKNPAPRLVAPVEGVVQKSAHSTTDTNNYKAYESPSLYWLGSNNAMSRTMYEPNVVECSVQLSPVDLYTLDLARPVYLRQFGKLFYIDSADIDGDNIAELKLVELKQ